MVTDQVEEEVGKKEAQSKCTKQFVTSAGKIVKCLSGQLVANQFIVVIVLRVARVLNQEDMRREVVTDKCLMRPVMSAKTVVRFLFNQAEVNRSTAVIVLERKKAQGTEMANNLKL